MSSASTPTAVQSLLSGVASSAQAGLTSAVTTALNDLTGIGLGLASEEAQDFDNFTDTLVEALESGQTWEAAWAAASSQLVAGEKSELMSAALMGLKDLGGIIDGFNKTLQAIL
jgi:hypothetical protein